MDGIGILWEEVLWLALWQASRLTLSPLKTSNLGTVMDNFFIV